jgi:sulfur carrier protein ThiS
VSDAFGDRPEAPAAPGGGPDGAPGSAPGDAGAPGVPDGASVGTRDRTGARTIRVEVTLKGSLATRLPGGRGPLDLPEGTTAEGVLAALGVPAVHCIYVVNGAATAKSTPLRDGDRLLVYPPMAGGAPAVRWAPGS